MSSKLDAEDLTKQPKVLVLEIIQNQSVKDKSSQMDEREKEIQRFGDFGQGEKLVNAKAKRQARGGSVAVVKSYVMQRRKEF